MQRILVSDYDFTFNPHFDDKEQNARSLIKNEKAIKRWRDAGNLFVFATGRSKESFTGDYPKWNDCADYAIVCDGSSIIDNSGRGVYGNCFGDEVAEKIREVAREVCSARKHVFISYTEDGEKEDVVPSANKMVAWTEIADDYEMIRTLLEEELGERLDIIGYCGITVIENENCLPQDNRENYHHMLNITIRDINKLYGIEKLIESQLPKINDAQVITVGDGPNDLPMIMQYDGYVVEHAGRDVKEKVSSSRLVPDVSALIDRLMN